MLWLLIACASPPVDSADSQLDAEFCQDVPVVRWSNFGQGFINGSCQGCHASSTPDRHKAPESITFDDVDQVWAQRDSILWSSTGESAYMPPNGGVTDDDRTRLEWWLRCAPEGS